MRRNLELRGMFRAITLGGLLSSYTTRSLSVFAFVITAWVIIICSLEDLHANFFVVYL